MSSRVVGAGLALIAALLLAVQLATPAVLPAQLALFAGHPTVDGHTRQAQDVYVGLYSAQLCRSDSDVPCKSGQARTPFRVTAYGELAATGVLAIGAVALALLTLRRSERRKDAARVVRITGAVALLLLVGLVVIAPFSEASTPVGLSADPLLIGLPLYLFGVLGAMLASVIAVRPPPPIKLRVAERAASVAPPSYDGPAGYNHEPARARRDSRGPVAEPVEPMDPFAASGPLRPLYEATPMHGGTGGLLPMTPSRASSIPTPYGDPAHKPALPFADARGRPPSLPPPRTQLAAVPPMPAEERELFPRAETPLAPPPPPVPGHGQPPLAPPWSDDASTFAPPFDPALDPATGSFDISMEPSEIAPVPITHAPPQAPTIVQAAVQAPAEDPGEPRGSSTLTAPPPIPQPPPSPPPRPAPRTLPPPLPGMTQPPPLPGMTQPPPLPQPPSATQPPPLPAPSPQSPPSTLVAAVPPAGPPPPGAPLPRPHRESQAPRPVLRAAVPMPARPSQSSTRIPISATRPPPPRPTISAPAVPPPAIPPIPGLPIPAIPGLPPQARRAETDVEDVVDAGGQVPVEITDNSSQTNVSFGVPDAAELEAGIADARAARGEAPPDTSPTGEPVTATPIPAPAQSRPMPKLPISTAPDTLPPPKDSKQASGPSPACPQCESPMAWVEEHLRFYCKSCRMYF